MIRQEQKRLSAEWSGVQPLPLLVAQHSLDQLDRVLRLGRPKIPARVGKIRDKALARLPDIRADKDRPVQAAGDVGKDIRGVAVIAELRAQQVCIRAGHFPALSRASASARSSAVGPVGAAFALPSTRRWPVGVRPSCAEMSTICPRSPSTTQ